MKLELSIVEDFGSRLSDGSKAAEYRLGRMDPYVDICDEIILDFTGVRLANSSFVNALISGFVEQHGIEARRKLRFKGCNPMVAVLVESAIFLGLQKCREKA